MKHTILINHHFLKDPVDMLYLLWSVYIGIICGCQLFEVGVLTSIVVTLVLLLLEHINFGRRPYVLIVHSDKDMEELLLLQMVII